MAFWKSLLAKFISDERRRAERRLDPPLAAYFWNGGRPIEHSVRDISASGLFLVTEERWYPGTLVMVTLQNLNLDVDAPGRSIAVQCRAVRWGEEGVGLQFVVPAANDHRRGQNLLAEGADRKTLDKFLESFREDNASAEVSQTSRPPKW